MRKIMTVLWCFAVVILISLSVFSGGKFSYVTVIALICLSFVPFFSRFERSRPSAQRLAVIAMLSAVAVAGRAVFFMLPQGKPAAALVIIAGALLGAESGFLSGALTVFVSNFFFGHGPWTPWQMLGMGLIGLFAGLFFYRREIKLPLLVLYGAFAAAVLYGALMDFSSALIFQGYVSLSSLAASFATGVWFNLAHGIATAVFLAVLWPAFSKKFGRIRDKYGFAA